MNKTEQIEPTDAPNLLRYIWAYRRLVRHSGQPFIWDAGGVSRWNADHPHARSDVCEFQPELLPGAGELR